MTCRAKMSILKQDQESEKLNYFSLKWTEKWDQGINFPLELIFPQN